MGPGWWCSVGRAAACEGKVAEWNPGQGSGLGGGPGPHLGALTSVFLFLFLPAFPSL